MIFSKPVNYAVRALICLAHYENTGPVLSSSIAKEQSIPAPYLMKILSTLTTAGLVTSSRGPGGGFSLGIRAGKIRLFDVLTLFEGLSLTDECLMGFGKCSDHNNCPAHMIWKEPKNHLMKFLKETTIADLAVKEIKNKKK